MAHFFKLMVAAFSLVFACETFAGPVPYSFAGMNVTREGGVTYLRGTSPSEMAAAAASVSANAVTGTGSATVAGTSAKFAASATLGSAASAAFKAAIRATPGIAGAMTITWLATQGFEYLNGQWMKQDSLTVPSDARCGMTAMQCALQASASYSQYTAVWKSLSGGTCYGGLTEFPHIVLACSASGAPAKRPATDTDWADSGTPSDGAYKEGLQNGVKLPVDKVTSTPPSKDVPLGSPYQDPVTGKRYQDSARLTPSADGMSADVQVTKQEVDVDGNPVKQSDGVTDKAPEKVEDPCKQNPDASACKPLDEVEDSELKNKDINLSLFPVPGFGPSSSSCPAPKHLFNVGSQSVDWEWSKFCEFSLGIRPIVLAFAWLAAIMMVVGVARREG